MSSRFPPSMVDWEENKDAPPFPSLSPPTLRRPGSDEYGFPRNSSRRSGYFEQVAGLSLGLTNLLAEHILAHPCVVLRRQCQINVNAKQFHRTPLTLFSPIYNLQQHQGISSLWKGVSNSILVQGIPYFTEQTLTNSLRFPKQITSRTSLQDVCRFLSLKSLAYALATPFYAATFLESVQSSGASDSSGVLEFVGVALERCWVDLTGRREGTRRLPFWLLIAPTVSFRLSHYLVTESVHYLALTTVQRHIQRKAVKNNRTSVFDELFPDLFAVFSSHLIADALLYPIETVLYRLYSQGTRVLFDNLDTGLHVASMETRYEGFVDAARSIFRQEGLAGFYKGFGALILQYTIYYFILRAARLVAEQLEEVKRSKATAPLPPLR